MEICAAEPERRNIGAAYAFLLPRRGLVYHAEQVEVYAGVGLYVIDGGGQNLVVDGERGLGNGNGAGRGLGVAYLGFYRSEAQFSAVAHVRAEHFAQHLHLGRVAHLGGCAVRFNKIHVGRGIIDSGEGVLYGYLLALGVGGGNAFALAVGGGAHGIDEGVDFVAVALRVGQALEHVD